VQTNAILCLKSLRGGEGNIWFEFFVRVILEGYGTETKVDERKALSVQLGFVAFAPFCLAFVFHLRPGGEGEDLLVFSGWKKRQKALESIMLRGEESTSPIRGFVFFSLSLQHDLQRIPFHCGLIASEGGTSA